MLRLLLGSERLAGGVVEMTLKDDTKGICRRLSARYGEISDENDREQFEVLLGVLNRDIDSFRRSR